MISKSRTDPARLAERIRWPDGPVCPYCGERERVAPDSSRDRLRYECVACGRHHGHIRRPGAPNQAPDGAPARRPVAPRFPPGE